MTTVTVTITYSPNLNVLDIHPDVVSVDAGHEIVFKRKGDLRGRIQLTFAEKELFDTDNGEFHLVGNEGSVRVRTRPRDRTTYLCQLLDEITGAEIARESAPRGGAVDPIRPANALKKGQ